MILCVDGKVRINFKNWLGKYVYILDNKRTVQHLFREFKDLEIIQLTIAALPH
jgi:hypothetical protein